MSSVTSAESESSPRPDKRPASPAQSPQPKRARPSELSLDNSAWEGDSAPTNSGEQSSIVSGSPRIQLPSIFSIEDPFRGEHRRASLPTLSSELSSRGRLHSVTPSSRGLTSVVHTPSSLSCYQFPQSSIDSDDKSSVRPKLAADTQLGLPFPDQVSLPSAATLSSSGTTTSSSTSPSFPTSSFASPLTTDYTLPRAQLPSLQFSDSEPWGTATGQPASLPGIVRPNSTPGPMHSTGGPLKYDDHLRHSSLSGSYTFPPANQAPMYGNVARISGQAERRASYSHSSSSEAKEEWSFSASDILLPSASTNGPAHSPSRTPPAPPASSSLVDRPQKKRGKLPKPTTDFLKDWLHRHSDHPYPSEDEKKQLCAATGLSMSQVSNWMINVGLTSVISPSFTQLTLIRLADGFSHPCTDRHLAQPQPIPFPPSAVVEVTLGFPQAHYFAERPCPLIVCNCTTHFLYNPSHTLGRVRSAPTHTTRPLTNEMSLKMDMVEGVHPC
jgi:hypothetical protein